MTSSQEVKLLKKDISSNQWSLPFTEKKLKTITLYHGIKSCQVELNPNSGSDSEWLLPPETAQKLRLSKLRTEYGIKGFHSGHYLLGPLVGVFVNDEKLDKLLSGNVDHIYRRFAKVLERNHGLAVFFSAKRILWHGGEVIGVVRSMRNSKEVWLDEILPIPTVIYDRCFGQSGKRNSKFLREKCASYPHKIRVINTLTKLGKIEIYQLCAQNPILSEYLPRWDILTKDNAQQLLEEYPVAYIKPDVMYKGKGVTMVTHEAGGYLLEQRRGEDNYRHLWQTADEIINDLGGYFSASSRMLIQDRISLMRYQNRPFDFRLLLQKDRTGQWKETGVVARINGDGSIISSPRSGGTVATFEEAMGSIEKTKRQEIKRTILRFGVLLAETIDKQIGSYVELGFDIGVDVDGKVWLIEVNGKPLKVSIDRLKNHNITVNAYERPLEYAIYLAGFGGTAHGE